LDFSFTLLFPRNVGYKDELNKLHRSLSQSPDYDFLSNFGLNEELMMFLTNLKEKYKIYMFTSGTIQNAPEIKDKVDALFDKIFSAEEMMLSKREPESYIKIAGMIDLPKEEILFVDDIEANVQAVRDAGLEAVQYIDNKSLMNYISMLE